MKFDKVDLVAFVVIAVAIAISLRSALPQEAMLINDRPRFRLGEQPSCPVNAEFQTKLCRRLRLISQRQLEKGRDTAEAGHVDGAGIG
jgi:hypothetical protein